MSPNDKNFRRSRSNRLGVGGIPKIFGTLGRPRPLWTGKWLTPRNMSPSLCCHAKFGH